MNQTWWVSREELNDEQADVISLPLDGSYFVTGPPGSGKTNLILLRANYATLAGQPNLAVIVFTRTLQEFIASGANKYDFPLNKVKTCVRWQRDIIQEYGGTVPKAATFELQRSAQTEAIWNLINERRLEDLYEVILLDEAQDYLPREIEMFDRLAKRIFVVADGRQKIYKGDDPIETVRSRVDRTVTLKYHFRNGLKICRLADAVGRDREDYSPLSGFSHYDEESRPSNVDHFRCADLDDQIGRVLTALEVQRQAYPDEMLGVCCPRNAEVNAVWAAIQKSAWKDIAVLQRGGEHAGFSPETRICVATLHAAKGLEFRALHLVGFEHVKSFRQYQRNVAFTAVTRAKTSLSVYHSADLPAYFQQALAEISPLPELPDVADVFGPKQKGKK